MSHHEALDAQQNGTSVLLAEHSNTERGFLPIYREYILVDLSSQADLVTISFFFCRTFVKNHEIFFIFDSSSPSFMPI